MDYQQTYGRYLDAVNSALAEHPLLASDTQYTDVLPDAPADGTVPEPLRSAMRYSLLLPGKRLRPVLLLAAYRLIADDWETAMPYAIALEMIHAYSLIHDDLPAMDDDTLRRGQPTNHLVFGENVAVLAGDGLYSLAFETMLTAALASGNPRALSAAYEIARRAGVRGMIAGQTLDVKLEGTQPREDMVHYIQRHKTGDLLTAPVTAGLMLAGADETQLPAGETYGEKLGRAFQIVDDLLDLRGDATILGKQTGVDAARGKMTWPAVYGEAASRKEAGKLIREAKEALNPFGRRAAFLRELAQQTLTRVS
ncbi:MAG: polyprenyl synthetase family protein [Clostridiales bacterium]|nr:polyprenyl synthetase family protein [Clostridiales bacterium]